MTLKNIRNTLLGSAVLYMVLGLIILFFPQMTLTAVCIIFGIALILGGLVRIIEYCSSADMGYMFRYDLMLGVVQLIIGILVLTHPSALMMGIPAVLSIALLVGGVLKAQLALDIKRMGYARWWISMLCAALCVALAVIILCNPFESANALFMLIGVSYIVDGALDLYTILRVSDAVKRYKDGF